MFCEGLLFILYEKNNLCICYNEDKMILFCIGYKGVIF